MSLPVPDLPEEYTFRLSRWRPVAVMPILVLVGAAYALVSALSYAVLGIQYAWAMGAFTFACSLLLWIPYVRAVRSPIPAALRLDSAGLHLLWPDRTEDWPWEAVRREAGYFTGWAVGTDERVVRLPTLFIGRREVRLVHAMLVRYAEEPVGRRDSEALIAGAEIGLPPAARRLLLGFTIWWGIWFGGLVAPLVAGMARSWPHLSYLPPPLAPLIAWLAPLVGVLVAAWVAEQVRRFLRMAHASVRFLPDGLEERWPGGRRFFPYPAIERITDQRRRPHGRWILVQSGKQRLKLGQGLPYFWGAVRLLRERAPQAVWEERGG
jgi:hypothetical protein